MSRQSRSDPFEIEGELKAESEKAYLAVFEDGQEHWIPKSRSYNIDRDDGMIRLTIPMWLAESNGLV